MVLKLVLFVNLCLLQFKGVSPEIVYIYRFSRAGQDSTLPCDTLKHHGPSCSSVDWIYNNNLDQSLTEVSEGKVVKNSPRSSRLRLNTDCSLNVHNVTDEDSGLFFCRLSRRTDEHTVVYLSVLTVSPAPPSLNPSHDGSITFSCTLSRYKSQSCGQNSLLWLDQTGTVLSGARITQNECVSLLTVEHQSEHRKYTCQYVDERNTVQISADYTPEVRRTGERGNTGVTSETVHRFSRAGQNLTLPCVRAAQEGPTCSRVDWIYNRNNLRPTVTEVKKGKVEENSPRSSRLRLNTDCSLIVHNVTDEDSGIYTCRLLDDVFYDTLMFLSVLTVSPTEPQQNGLMTFKCTLGRYNITLPCRQNSILWVDQTGTVLSGARITQNKCVSHLTVERQSEHRKYTCQYVERNTVQISADYTPEVREEGRIQPGNTGLTEVFIGVGAVASLLVLLVVAAVVFFKIRAKRSAAETTEGTEGDVNPADSAMVECENFSPGSVSEDSTYQSLCPATRDPDQVYSQLRPQPQGRVTAPPGGRKS